MSGVDVLAALKSEAAFLRMESLHASATRVDAIGDAVAELIEANVELAAANADPRHTMGRDLRVITAEKRLTAALARVQGAQP